MNNTKLTTAANKATQKNSIDFGLLSESLGYAIRRAQLKVFQEFNYFFEELDIKPAQFSILEIIHNNPGLRQSALAHSLSIQRTNLVGMLDRLQDSGLIERRPRTQDLRSHALYLTGEGEKLLTQLHHKFHLLEALLLQRIGVTNIQTVRQSLEAIIHAPDING